MQRADRGRWVEEQQRLKNMAFSFVCLLLTIIEMDGGRMTRITV